LLLRVHHPRADPRGHPRPRLRHEQCAGHLQDDGGGGCVTQDRAAVVTALRGLVAADAVITEPHELARYEKGWRYGSGTALAVVRPADTGEVSRVLAFASAQGLRVLPQGA